MTPQKGQYVKIVFRNSTQLEGFVETWSSAKSILKTRDEQSFCVIMKTDEDVMVVKIMTAPPKTIGDLQKHYEETNEEFQEVLDSSSDDELRTANLVKLKKMMAEQEAKIIRDKLKSHTITEVRKPEYGIPQFLKK